MSQQESPLSLDLLRQIHGGGQASSPIGQLKDSFDPALIEVNDTSWDARVATGATSKITATNEGQSSGVHGRVW